MSVILFWQPIRPLLSLFAGKKRPVENGLPSDKKYQPWVVFSFLFLEILRCGCRSSHGWKTLISWHPSSSKIDNKHCTWFLWVLCASDRPGYHSWNRCWLELFVAQEAIEDNIIQSHDKAGNQGGREVTQFLSQCPKVVLFWGILTKKHKDRSIWYTSSNCNKFRNLFIVCHSKTFYKVIPNKKLSTQHVNKSVLRLAVRNQSKLIMQIWTINYTKLNVYNTNNTTKREQQLISSASSSQDKNLSKKAGRIFQNSEAHISKCLHERSMSQKPLETT